jgi:DNA-binding GntR family transcriptional regulator
LQKNTSLALCSVLELASDPTRQISAAKIADKYGVSAHHLAKVLAELARARVVESVPTRRVRMATDEAKAIYKNLAAVAELPSGSRSAGR